MNQIEQAFTKELIENCHTARRELGFFPERLLQMIERDGGLNAIRNAIARQKTTESFDRLCKLGRLDLSPEATATKACYQSLFSDEEVDFCLEMLCECGYYGQ